MDIMVSLNTDLFFEVIQQPTGGFTAQCLNADIRTKGDRLVELADSISSAVSEHFGTRPKPPDSSIHVLFYKE